ncbi:ubiquinone-menaquinone biosynthesis methyltransferase protein [Marine Group I thaumarchaeote SCGC RSA3]|uniref:3-demethylubiquinone-9 3-methyltransferase protein n=2 Tax=Marine Group I TaxID=905826 RepID=A0A087RM39_9ARCH|nr:3-demethylubiquinone-9 3-methyltransferase protein [Marine Group I thaumarchaeote SCGC AAA799-D11]KFM19937.1 ubiquinone-menaquinone biosynthesis methyltransferase protein [Marine Group I thaumarchaeote SCGC RSA3]
MLKKTSTILADPIDKQPLNLLNEQSRNNEILSGTLKSNNNKYFIESGLANLIPNFKKMNLDSDLYQTWNTLQENGMKTYQNFPSDNLLTEGRELTKLFKNFCNFSGTVLDVGCGPTLPAYLKNNDKIQLGIGLDPLISTKNYQNEKNIDLIQGIGEFLPFKNEIFDFVSFCTSFDHVVNPNFVLNESKRVLKENGTIIFLNGIHGSPKSENVQIQNNNIFRNLYSKINYNNPIRKSLRTTIIFGRNQTNKIIHHKQVKEQKFIKNLPVPNGAMDQFHMHYWDNSELNKQCEQLNLKKINEKILPDLNSEFLMYQKI